jgi:hypothetical protein
MNHQLVYFIYKIIGVTLSVFLITCNKEVVSNPDLANTKIIITTPIAKTTFNNGEIVAIKAKITSDVSMHGYEILLHEDNTNVSNTIKTRHTHGKEFLIDETYKVECIKNTDYTLEIIAFINHSGVKLAKKVQINCK